MMRLLAWRLPVRGWYHEGNVLLRITIAVLLLVDMTDDLGSIAHWLSAFVRRLMVAVKSISNEVVLGCEG
ncbi:MAG: hypothetical protein U1D30_05765 [Planctomycetota bacterium]